MIFMSNKILKYFLTLIKVSSLRNTISNTICILSFIFDSLRFITFSNNKTFYSICIKIKRFPGFDYDIHKKGKVF